MRKGLQTIAHRNSLHERRGFESRRRCPMLLDLIGLRPLASPRRWRSFLFCLEKRVFSRFKAFLVLSYRIYRLGKENGLNRIFEKNNFRNEIGQKKCNFFLVENQ